MIRDWSVLVYMAANNNLGEGLKGCLKHQLGDLEPSDRVTIAVESSHLTQVGYTHPDRVSHTRSIVARKGLTELEKMPYRNMADPATLEDFLVWGIKKFPAKRTMIVLQGHGAAWTPTLPDQVTRIDDQGQATLSPGGMPRGGDGKRSAAMPLPQLRATLERVYERTGVMPAVLAFDSCLMGNAEVLHELSGITEVLIASEDRMHSPERTAENSLDYAAPLKTIFQTMSDRLEAGEDVTPQTCAGDWVASARRTWTTPTLSAFACDKAPALSQSLDALAETLLGRPEQVKAVLARTHHLGGDSSYPEYDPMRHLYDLGHLLDNILAEPALASSHQAARDARERYLETRIAHQSQPEIHTVYHFSYGTEDKGRKPFPAETTTGLSVWLPDNPKIVALEKKYDADYNTLRFPQDTSWGRLVAEVSGS